MKYKVGSTTDEIEIGQYHELNKGALKAKFTLLEYPSGRKTLDCCYFESGKNLWFTFPSRQVKYADGRKSDYFPYITYLNKDYLEHLKVAVLAALREYNPKDEDAQAHTYQKQAAALQDEPPFIW